MILQLRETLRGLLEVRVAAQDVADLIDVVACLQARERLAEDHAVEGDGDGHRLTPLGGLIRGHGPLYGLLEARAGKEPRVAFEVELATTRGGPVHNFCGLLRAE